MISWNVQKMKIAVEDNLLITLTPYRYPNAGVAGDRAPDAPISPTTQLIN